MPKKTVEAPQPMTAETFCSLQGCDQFTTFAVKQSCKNLGEKTYGEWYDLLKDDYRLGDKLDIA